VQELEKGVLLLLRAGTGRRGQVDQQHKCNTKGRYAHYLVVYLVGKMEWLHGFLVKLAWKPELKLCLDWRKYQWWSNHETASEERSLFHFVLFFAVVISTKKKSGGFTL
jgi:hypothetical protein